EALAGLATTLVMEKKFSQAEPLARESLGIRERKSPDDWATFSTRRMLGSSLLGQKKYAEAEPVLLAAYQGMKQREAKIPPLSKVRLKEALQALAQLCDAQGRTEQAAQWRRKLDEFESGQSRAPSAAELPKSSHSPP